MQKLLSKGWLVRHMAVLVVFIILLNFGFWQLRRLEQKRERNNSIVAALNQSPTLLNDQAIIDPEIYHFKPVQATGTFDNSATMFLRNRDFEGFSGVHLLVPLRLAGSDRAVLVDRGWVPRGNMDPTPEELAVYDQSGQVTVTGIAYRGQPQPDGWLVPRDPPLKEGQTRLVGWFRVNIDRIQEQLPYPLMPIYLEQSPAGPEPALDSFPRQSGSVALDEGPHLGYAIQWFSFAAILLITYGYFIQQEL